MQFEWREWCSSIEICEMNRYRDRQVRVHRPTRKVERVDILRISTFLSSFLFGVIAGVGCLFD
jgi:hypothetical protein